MAAPCGPKDSMVFYGFKLPDSDNPEAEKTPSPPREDTNQNSRMEEAVFNGTLYNWRDITEEFRAATGQLHLGQLIHDKTFGLFEAMSAIEMMDPKMDAGMMCNQTKRKVLNLDESIKAGVVKLKDLTMPELIGIIDASFACLVTWLEGHSLAQTVFTNLYLHDPHVIQDSFLKAFCICHLKTTDVIRDRVNRAASFEEEDFQSTSYGFKMAAEVSDARCTGMAKETEDELNRLIKNTRAKNGEKRDPLTEEEHDLATALYSRMRFARLFFQSLVLLSKEKCAGVPDAERSLAQAGELVPTLINSIHLGIRPQTTPHDQINYPVIAGFEPLVNQRLLPSTFPRYTRIRDRHHSWTYLEGLLHRLLRACSITRVTSLHSGLEYLSDFSQMVPCVLSRSIIQLLYLPQSRRILGTQLVGDAVRDMIRTFIATPVLSPKGPLSAHAQAKECSDQFVNQCTRPVCNMVQLFGHNRARQRDKWVSLLDDLAVLQEEADKVDSFLHGLVPRAADGRSHLACYGTWVLYHTLQAMISYVLAGFELELYAVHEYHYVYWYLYECLYTWLVTTLSRADSFLAEQESANSDAKTRNSKKNKNKSRKKTPVHAHEISLNQAYQHLCGGYYKAILGFSLGGKLRAPDYEFDNEEIRYQHRFQAFSNIMTPPQVSYKQYKEMTDLTRLTVAPSAEDAYTIACRCFHQAKTLYEGLPNQTGEVVTLARIAKTNYVVMKLLSGGHKRDSKMFRQRHLLSMIRQEIVRHGSGFRLQTCVHVYSSIVNVISDTNDEMHLLE